MCPYATKSFKYLSISSFVTISTSKYKQEIENYEVTGLSHVTAQPQNWLVAISWERYLIFTVTSNHHTFITMDVMWGSTMQIDAHRVNTHLRADWEKMSNI